jgi:hypothetical protein
MSYKLLNKNLFILSSQSVVHQKSFYFVRHSGLDPEPSACYGGIQTSSRRKPETVYTVDPDFHREPWIPAGVYPVLDTGRE